MRTKERKDQVMEVAVESGAGAARRRFGGFDLPAALAGMLAALGLTVLLGGLAAGAGSFGYQRGSADTTDLSNAGLIAGLVVLPIAFFIGGWVAGRMARYDGALNGLLSAGLFVAAAGGVSAVGTWWGKEYDFFQRVNLPQWFSGPSDTMTMTYATLGIALMVVAAVLGGARGARYHRRADAVVASGKDAPVTSHNVITHDVSSRDAEVDVTRSDYAGRHAVL